MRPRGLAVALLAACAAVAACTPVSSDLAPRPTVSGPTPSTSASPVPSATSPAAAPPTNSPTPTATPYPTPTPTARPTPRPPEFATSSVLRDIRRLADDIGPREATSDSFVEAAGLVERRFERYGYEVRRTRVRVPAGNSWGTPVDSGRSANVIAEPDDFDPRRPHVVVGAHLDTIPVAPGAEDNASGIAVMLELARMSAEQRLPLPVQFIAFGAEEPRGTGDALHHFGSQQYVADLSGAERDAIVGMVALDRVGVRASYVPVCRSPLGGAGLRDDVRAAARRVDVPTRSCSNTTSDHWSYAKVDVPAIRLGGIPYAGYHSRGDVPSVVDRRQLDRVGTVMWSWLGDLR